MTRFHEWNPMPHRLAIHCPGCGALAQFEFAEVLRIERSADVPFFQESDIFEYRLFEDSNGSRWHGAVFYPGLRTIGQLPEGYSAEAWDHGESFFKPHILDAGTAACRACGHRNRHALDWPGDAYFQIDHKGQTLWAFDQESARELLAYIQSEDRRTDRTRWARFLRHVPSHFLKKGARENVSKRLSRLLKQVNTESEH